jgi:cytochrome P450
MVETDPFEAFNRRQGMGKVRDPYPRLAEMRRRGPVQRMSIQDMLGPDMSVSNLIKMDVYAALSHDAVAEVLRDGDRFSSKGYSMSMGPVMGRTILEMDEPEHGRYRRLLQHAFSRKALDRWQHELVNPVVNRLIDRFVDRGSAELIRELTFPFPVSVIAGMIGVPEEDLADFHRWAIELISVGFNPMGGLDASRKLGALFQRVLEERRREPRDDLMSVLAFSTVEGTHLNDEEIVSFCRLLAPAGAETTYRSSSNLLFGLLSHPDQLDAVRRDPALIPQAIEEGLRWEAPLTNILRLSTRDTQVCGVPIPAGAFVSVNLGAANRDETRYERPDAFDVFRPPKTHMAFAFGAHRCLGMHLATMETSVVLRSLFERLPGLRLDPDAEDVHITGMIFRTPLALPVRFDPA